MNVELTATLGRLARQLHGRLVCESDADYDVERLLWNAIFDRRPVAIAKCTGAVDVVRAVEFAREHELGFTVCSGRHDMGGKGMQDGTLCIDTGPMRGVFVDPVARRAVVQAGCQWGIVDRELQQFGLAFTAGVNSDTGVAGLTLGGGIGHLMRKCGATVDSVRAVNGVTVEGQLVRASVEENPELFWAVRGAGSNFLIATSFEFDLHAVGPEVVAGVALVPGKHARELLRLWRDVVADADRDISVQVALICPLANHPSTPPELWEKPLVHVRMLYLGDHAKADGALRPLREGISRFQPYLHTFGPMPYTEYQRRSPQEEDVVRQQQTGFAEYRPRAYQKGGYTNDMSDAFIDGIVDGFESAPRGASGAGTPIYTMMRMGGAVAEVPEEAMAFSRKGDWWWEVAGWWDDPEDDEAWIAWTRGVYDRLGPFSISEGYINLTVSDDVEYLRGLYGPAKFDRLAALKRKWDPENHLRFNKNVPPHGNIANGTGEIED